MKVKLLLIVAAPLMIVTMLSGLTNKVSAQLLHLYGMTEIGGANSMGTLFEFNLMDSTFTKKLDFAGTPNGSNPFGSLMQASDGNLYGMTWVGGANNKGVLFQYNTVTSTYTKKLDFDGTTTGGTPRGELMQALDGNLYGMNEVGGVNGGGVLFQYNPATSAFTDLYNFGAQGGSGPVDGEQTFGSLVQASDGNIYGMTYGGGENMGKGVIFEYNPVSSTYTKQFDFAGTTNGSSPTGNLIQANDGYLYGMTYLGGGMNGGVLFLYDFANSALVVKHDFGVSGASGTTGPMSGMNPAGSLLQASDGKLYGTTTGGGAYNAGVLFQYNPVTYVYTKKFDFDGIAHGSNPYGSLIQASNGMIYGMTKTCGADTSAGVIFQYNPVSSTVTKIFDFSLVNGKHPMFSNLIELAATTGLNNFSANNSFSLSPNPATNQLTIHTSSFHDETITVSVMNVLGETLQQEKIRLNNETSISIKKLSAGIYFLQLKAKSGTMVQKFIKE